MSEKLTTSSVQEFLKDFLTYSETSILEEGKEKDDILEVAQARGYNLKDNPDLAGFKTIYTFADKANLNRARLPKEKLLKALPGMIGKPVDIDHTRDFVVGHYIDYRYKQAEDMVVAYGVFYKSNFGEEWATAQKLFKSGKLGTSYEIWCPKNKRKYLPDGTYELTEMEIAGGGLMFKEKPAFENAKVLELAKKHSEERAQELVMASVKKYDGEEIITSAESSIAARAEAISKVAFVPVEQPKVVAPVITEVKQVVTPSNVAPVVPVVTPPVVPVVPIIPKILCGNCKKEFDNVGAIANQSDKKCPNCQAIVDAAGVVKYPPQIMDFNMSCPGCHATNWLLKSSTEDIVNVNCLSCKKEYNFYFEKTQDATIKDQILWLYIGSANCPQCNTYMPFSTVSSAETKELKCPSCQLNFTVPINKSKSKRKISKIEEVAVAKAPAEGGEKKMDVNDKVVKEEVQPIPAPVVKVEAPAKPIAASIEVPVVASVEVPVVAEVVIEAPVVVPVADVIVAQIVEPEAPVAEIVTPVIEAPVVEAAATKPMKTQEEIEKIEMDLCKAVKKGQKSKDYFKKAMLKLREMKKAAKLNKASIDENEILKAKIELLEISAVKILERKNVLGECSKELSEKDILNDEKFEMAKMKKENAELKSQLVTSSTPVAVKPAQIVNNEVAKRAKKIDEIAFKK